MTIRTIGSDEARLKLRDLLDDVHTGTDVIIERYRKPAAVLVNYTEWQALKAMKRAAIIAEAKANLAKAKADPSTVITHDELMRLMLEKQAAHVDA